MPKISVMTCTCRDFPNLDKMANCLVKQTFTDFEWIIIDRKIRTRPNYYGTLQDIVGGKFPVRVIEPKWSIYHDFSMPAMSNARNSGILFASGDLLCWVDDNIWFKPDFLQRHYNASLLTYEGKPCYMVGLGWRFDDWNSVEGLSKKEPFDENERFCREGTWDKNNPQYVQGIGNSGDDPRAYLSYPWPDGSGAKMFGEYEVVTGAWCYGRNMSMPREATLDINGNDEEYDGSPGSTDIEYGLRLNNYGFKTLLDRTCCVYEYTGNDNIALQKMMGFFWGHIGEVNGVKVIRNEYQNWAIMKTPSRWKANAYFDLKQMRNEFRNNTYRIDF